MSFQLRPPTSDADKPIATGFDFEPLPDGNVLIEFFGAISIMNIPISLALTLFWAFALPTLPTVPTLPTPSSAPRHRMGNLSI